MFNNKTFQPHKNKRLLTKLIFFFISLLLITSCDSNLFGIFGKDTSSETTISSENNKVTIELRSDDHEFYEGYVYDKGIIIPRPTYVPTKVNHTFIDWYSNGALHDFSAPIYQNTLIIAKFELNLAAARKAIEASELQANVTVRVKHYNTTHYGTFETDVGFINASGVIFAETTQSYWVITNNHVVEPLGRTHRAFYILDYKNNEYNAFLHDGSENSDYDLATLYFVKKHEVLKPITIASNNGSIDREVIAIGQPLGLRNIITFGVITRYAIVELRMEEDGDIYWTSPFACVIHSAKTDFGSSGGMLLNHKLELIGINVGANEARTMAFAIPITEVLKYLHAYVYV